MAAKGTGKGPRSEAEARTQRTRAQGGNLKPATKGEVRNPSGKNGWSSARERVRDALVLKADDLAAVLIEMAERGDTQALKLAMGPLLPAQKQEHEHTGEVNFTWSGDDE